MIIENYRVILVILGIQGIQGIQGIILLSLPMFTRNNLVSLLNQKI